MVEKLKPRSGKPRLSVGLTEGELTELLSLKDRHNVSMAWLGRQAILEFVAKYREENAQLPLRLTRPGHK
jgi:hypothetical protein